MSEMTLEQKAVLEPFAQLYATMGRLVREMSDEDLKAALDACYAASTTNCWHYTFHAAQYVQREIRSEMHQREHRAKVLAETA